jgi:hypothetical protein
MSLHLIIGAGPVGPATAVRLAAGGQQVRLITRSGTGPDAAGIEKVAVARWLIRGGGPTSPYLWEFREVAYQFNAPFVVNTAFTSTFDTGPTPARHSPRP